jgi:hypothetical protein
VIMSVPGAKPRTVVCTATTGAAAAVFGGNTRTIHSAFGITNKEKRGPDGALPKLDDQRLSLFQELYRDTKLVVIDEVSMLTTTLLGDVHTRLQQITGDYARDFGGMSIVNVGDFQQLPPATGTPIYSGVLKSLSPLASENISAHERKSRELWKAFEITYLTHFKRCTDPELAGFLSEMRDLNNVYPLQDGKLIARLMELQATPDDLEEAWSEAKMCVLSNSERHELNAQIVQLSAKELGDVLLTWENEITTPSNMPRELEDCLRTKFDGQLTGFFLQDAPVVLTSNLAPVIQVANGSTGVLDSIVYLDEKDRKKANDEIAAAVPGSIVKLSKRPDYVVVKMDQPLSTSAEQNKLLNLSKKLFPDRPDCSYLVPLAYEKDRFKKNAINLATKASPSFLRWRRFNYDLGFVVTAYKLQGATIEYLLVDLNQRPLGLKAMDLRALYVILSRVAHMSRIRIMPFRPHVSNPTITKDNFLDYLKNVSQCPELAAWKECIDPDTLKFDPAKYVGVASKTKKKKQKIAPAASSSSFSSSSSSSSSGRFPSVKSLPQQQQLSVGGGGAQQAKGKYAAQERTQKAAPPANATAKAKAVPAKSKKAAPLAKAKAKAAAPPAAKKSKAAAAAAPAAPAAPANAKGKTATSAKKGKK